MIKSATEPTPAGHRSEHLEEFIVAVLYALPYFARAAVKRELDPIASDRAIFSALAHEVLVP